MAKYTGTIRKIEVEGGHWNFVSDDGDEYTLEFHDESQLAHGRRVEVSGKVDRQAMGIAMSGPILKAQQIVPLPPKGTKDDQGEKEATD